MANIKSAKKRVITNEKKAARNARVKAHCKAAEKAFHEAVDNGDAAEAEAKFKVTEKKLMQAGAKGTLHKNKVSRTVARLQRDLNELKSQN